MNSSEHPDLASGGDARAAPSPTRTEEALARAALAVSRDRGSDVFEGLVEELAAILEVDVAAVAVYEEQKPGRMRTLGAWLDGRRLRNFDYALAGTPCEQVVGRDFLFVERGASKQFPPGTLFAAKQMDCYAAFPLVDAAGEPLGLLVVMNRVPIGSPAFVESMMKIFAVRLSAEIERRHTEEAFRRAALAVSGARGEQVFSQLVGDLAAILGVEMAFIAQPKPDDPCTFATRAVHYLGKSIARFEYVVQGTPCETVIGQQYRVYPCELTTRFPHDLDFKRLRFESYAGFPLADTRGDPIGIISIASRRPLRHLDLCEAILKIFAVRAAAEIERHRSDEALRASEASYREIFEAAVDPIFVHDWDTGAIVDVNPAACGNYGYSHDELLSIDLDALGAGFPPYTAADAARLMAQAKLGVPVQTEWHRRNRDGTLRWDEVRLKPAVIGGVRRVLAFTRDITQRKLADERLRASEEQYRTIFNASVDGMLLWAADHRVVDVNDAFLGMHGFAREDVLGQTRPACIPHELQARCEQLLPGILAGAPCHIEARSQRSDGTLFDVEIHGIPMQYQGQPHVLVILRDVTERRLAEERLRASEEQYRAIFNASADGLVLRDAAFRVVDINPVALSMSGASREQVLGSTETTLSAGHMQAEIRAMHRRVLAGEPVRYEAQRRDLHGRRVDLEIRLVPATYRYAPHVLAIARDITELHQATEALRTSEEQYRAVFNASLDGMAIRRMDGTLVDVNPALVSMYGYEREELIGGNPGPTIPREGLPRFAAMLEAVGAGRTHRDAVSMKRRDGSRLCIEVHASAVMYQGSPHVLSVVRDITARKADEDRLRATVEAALDSIIVMDAQGRIVEFNPAAVACFGHRREAVIGQDLADMVIPQRLRDAHRRGMARLRSTGHGPYIGRRVEVTAMRADGTEFPAELTIAVTEGPEGKLFVGYLRDITERKRAEEALRVSGEQYRAIFNAAVDALVLRDAEFRVVDVNPAYEAMTGYTLAEVSGADYVVANPSGINERVKALHQQALAGKAVSIETQIIPREAEPLEVELRGVPTVHQGRPHVLYIGRDITERKRAEVQRAALEAQLRQAQKMEAIGHLTGGIAHDFNNILTSVMGYVGLATERDSALEDPKLGSYLEQALRSCRRARDLIQQMLIFSRGQRGERRSVELASLVGESTQLLRSTLPSTLTLRTDIEQGLPRVHADPVQIDQVILNLAINARDALGGSGDVMLRLARCEVHDATCTSCRKPADGVFVELVVSDDGPGIAPGVVDRMFEPFFSTKEVGKGSGMGLATVHGIVHDHGGHIVVESAPGAGATFRILLPAMAPSADSAAPRASEHANPAGRVLLDGHVLVVDDEESVAAYLQELLQNWGLRVTATTSPAAARTLVAQASGHFDLVITDLTMPGMTGLELAADIAELVPALPIILATGYADKLTDARLRSANVGALIRKPIEPAQLRELIERHLTGPS